jgi:hypothetical protein
MRMPPPKSNKAPLTAEQVEEVKAWVAGGAKYEPHWAFVPPKRPPVPEVKDAGAVKNDIDRFLLSRLESEGIGYSPEADRATLLRRVFLDLTGLPPTPEEVDEFLADSRPDAYEQCVDELLTTEPHKTRYAERMTAPWMDQARYADTCGIHMDAGRQMWLYRDWVLNAYRDNMPFDQFVKQQIAGDLIPDATDDQRIASGFNRCHVTTDEGGAIADEYLVEYAVDRTATTGLVFLGLTLGCARCHDHKFDPVTTADFYSLYAFFDSIEEPGLYSQSTDANRAHEPFIRVPTAAQKSKLADISDEIASLKKKQEERTPDEEDRFAAFLKETNSRAGISWASSRVTGAKSTHGSTLTIQTDGSVVVSGENPKVDEHEITLRTDGTDLRTLLIEALPEPSAPEGGPGRAFNGNGVLQGVTVEAVSAADPTKKKQVQFSWAWADHSQGDGDYEVANLLDADGPHGWALGAHVLRGERVAMLVASEPFGFEGGTVLHVLLNFKSRYDYHTFAHVRLSVGSVSEAGLELLPVASGGWFVTGPFPPDAEARQYEPVYGPEEGDELDFSRNFGFGNQYWRFEPSFADAKAGQLASGINVSYVGKHVYSPTARRLDVSLGSDDGFKLFVNGEEIASRVVDRGVAPNQDKASIYLRPGRNTVVMKIINTGGPGGFYYRAIQKVDLQGDLVAALLNDSARSPDLAKKLAEAWRIAFLPKYREAAARIAALEKQSGDINAAVAQTMVMKELPQPRETYVLTRGQYDKPDKNRPVSRGVPKSLGTLPEDAPANRLGLADWLISRDNPLMARVTVNRLWELAFGTGLVRTTEDFGLQGEWPSHPELLDWLAVEFQESGWDVQHMLRLIVTSAAYRQRSYTRPELREKDPENRLLASYPRRRLTAEQTRDQALYVSGLLVEKLGGPSVKPYQPGGLWQEVAMPQSNTREYQRGMGPDLWRRSLYTYWKRASPPPAMLTFDAPTREFCTIRRASTSTPLQALVLWNDEQFVEAARVLAQRTLAEPGDDAARLTRMYRRCAIQTPSERDLALIQSTLDEFRTRYKGAPDDAVALMKDGASPLPDGIEKSELAAWTMVASALMNLYDATTQE